VSIFGIFGAGFMCINGRRHSSLQDYGFARLPVVHRNPRPKGQWSYMQTVYAVVEWLWNQLPAGDKVYWQYGWKPKHFSGRDYFGRHNMVYVARWNRWVRRPPSHHADATPHVLAPLSEPVPEEFSECLGGDFVAQPPAIFQSEQYYRSAFHTGLTAQLAWDAAYALVMSKPFLPSVPRYVHNKGHTHNFGASWGAEIYQGYCVSTLGAGVLSAWSPWGVQVLGGWPGTGPKGYAFEVRGIAYATRAGDQAPDILAGFQSPRKGMIIKGWVPGWPQYPCPVNPDELVGVDVQFFIPQIYGR
jgi:hypothetical protein